MSKIAESNFSLKVASVAIAIVLWLYAINEINPETTRPVYDVPVEIINEDALLGDGLTLGEEPVDTVNVRLRGLNNDINKVNKSNIKAVLDLSKIEKTGEQDVVLKVEGIQPQEVKLDKIPEITINIENIINKVVPVSADISGDQSEGFYFHNPVIEPSTVTIYGAESLVESVVQGIVEVNLDSVESSLNQSLPIKLVDDTGEVVSSKYLSLRQEYAMVSIPIYPVKTVNISPQIIGTPAEGFLVEDIQVTPSTLEVNGYANVIESLEELTTEAIDIQGATEDLNITVDLETIDGVYINPNQPKEINISVKINESNIDRNFIISDIDIKGLPDGYVAEVDGGPITIKATGLYTVITALTKEDFNLAIDLSQIEPGEHEVPLILTAPEGLQEATLSSRKVAVVVVGPEHTGEETDLEEGNGTTVPPPEE